MGRLINLLLTIKCRADSLAHRAGYRRSSEFDGVPIGKQRHIRKGVAMRTHKELKHLDPSKVSPSRPSYERRKPSRKTRNPAVANAAEQALQRKLTGLVQEHRDLDGAISVLFETRTCDPLLMTRLKKRKLQLKDEIARIAG